MQHNAPNYNIVQGKSEGVDHMTGGKGPQVVKGKGIKGQQVSPWNKGKGKTGKGVYQSYGLWDMQEGQQEDVTSQGWLLGALTLFNLNEDFPKWRQVPKKKGLEEAHPRRRFQCVEANDRWDPATPIW